MFSGFGKLFFDDRSRYDDKLSRVNAKPLPRMNQSKEHTGSNTFTNSGVTTHCMQSMALSCRLSNGAGGERGGSERRGGSLEQTLYEA